MKLELINVHWFKRESLNNLLDKGALYRDKPGSVPIKSFDELSGQIARKSVWFGGYELKEGDNQ